MDSITQITLGAAVGEAVLGRKVGHRAALWGAVCGTLPDLDVLIPLGDAVSNFTYHRGYSHSLLGLTLVSPLIGVMIHRIQPCPGVSWKNWWMLTFLVLFTHPLLDSFTVYGTQVFLPFSDHPVSGSAIFIIDPLYTFPLLAGLLATLFVGRTGHFSRWFNLAGITLSCLYLVWTVSVKLHVEDVARQSLITQGMPAETILSTPAPFNSLLWRVVSMGSDQYYEGMYSILDSSPSVRFQAFPTSSALLEELAGHWPVERLKWFTHGFFSINQRDSDVVMSDLRMGIEPDYVFQFKVGEVTEQGIIPVANRAVTEPRNYERLTWIWHRIWSETATEN